MTFSFPLSQDPAPALPAQKPDDDVTRLARLALVIGGLLSLAVTAAMGACVLWGWVGTWRGGFGGWLSMLALAWTGAAVFGAWWTFAYKVRRPVTLEDEARAARKPKQEIQTVLIPAAGGELLELYGWRALAYQLMTEHPDDLTREYAEKALHIPQLAYAKLNQVFIALALKSPKAWNAQDDLIGLLDYDRVTFDPDGRGAWVNRQHLIFKD